MVTTERLLLSRCCWATPRENPVSGMSKKSGKIRGVTATWPLTRGCLRWCSRTERELASDRDAGGSGAGPGIQGAATRTREGSL